MTKLIQLIIFLFILGFLFAVSSCKQEKKNKFQPGLPNAKNFNKEYKSDSCLFSISIKGDSILIADNDTSCFIKDFNLIDSFVCSGLKSGRIDPEKDYPIILYIDSMTPYPIVDRLIEELLLIDFNGFYFKTNNNGFKLGFPERDYELEEELIKLYGQKFERRRSIINKCYEEKKSNVNIKEEAPPPPPPPPPGFYMSYGFYEYTEADFKEEDRLDYRIVEIKNDKLLLNNEVLCLGDFGRAIYKKDIVFIKMNSKNVYKDFIRLVDVIFGVRNIKMNDYSLNIYKKKYPELNKGQQYEIINRHGIGFDIWNFARQGYFKIHKNVAFGKHNQFE